LRILISGSSGFVGKALFLFLKSSGHQITRLVREKNIPDTLYWDPERKIIPEIKGFDAVIHLSGRNVATRWTEKVKQEIFSSRVDSTRLLVEELVKSPPKVFICASAVGYYGDRGEELLTEKSGPGTGFLATVCQEWEAATRPIRCVNARFGAILSKDGGMLAKMLPAFRLGLGTVFGSGDQFISWIALEDVLHGIEHILHSDLVGPINFTSPHPETNRSFSQKLAKAVHRPLIFRMGERPLRMLFGEMAEIFLRGEKVKPERLLQSGYQFRYPTLSSFLSEI